MLLPPVAQIKIKLNMSLKTEILVARLAMVLTFLAGVVTVALFASI